MALCYYCGYISSQFMDGYFDKLEDVICDYCKNNDYYEITENSQENRPENHIIKIKISKKNKILVDFEDLCELTSSDNIRCCLNNHYIDDMCEFGFPFCILCGNSHWVDSLRNPCCTECDCTIQEIIMFVYDNSCKSCTKYKKSFSNNSKKYDIPQDLTCECTYFEENMFMICITLGSNKTKSPIEISNFFNTNKGLVSFLGKKICKYL